MQQHTISWYIGRVELQQLVLTQYLNYGFILTYHSKPGTKLRTLTQSDVRQNRHKLRCSVVELAERRVEESTNPGIFSRLFNSRSISEVVLFSRVGFPRKLKPNFKFVDHALKLELHDLHCHDSIKSPSSHREKYCWREQWSALFYLLFCRLQRPCPAPKHLNWQPDKRCPFLSYFTAKITFKMPSF